MYQRYTEQELCDAIYKVVFDSEIPIGRHQIAALIGRKKSPHIWRMVEKLVAGGWFLRGTVKMRNGADGFVYTVNKNKLPEGAC